MLSPKENLIQLYNHEMPEYLPFFGEGIKNVVIKGYYEMPKIQGHEGYDWFGVHWVHPEGDPAPMPGPDFLMEDINDWREMVKFPDLDAFDWEQAAATDNPDGYDRGENLIFQRLHNGLFERLHFLMGFENALCALLTDPEEVEAFLDRLVEFKCKLVDKIAQYYKPDILCYHDDWGTQRGLFFSPDTWRRFFKDRTKTIIDHVHSKGIKFEMHSCGMVKELVPELVDDLHVDTLNIMSINNIPELKKVTGDKVVYDIYLNTQKYDVMESAGTLTEEALRQGIREEIMECAPGGCYLPSLLIVRPEWAGIIHEEYEKCKAVLYR